MPEPRHEAALRHVVRGREIVAEQRALVERLQGLGQNTRREEELLDRFERSLAIFECDLQQIEQRKL